MKMARYEPESSLCLNELVYELASSAISVRTCFATSALKCSATPQVRPRVRTPGTSFVGRGLLVAKFPESIMH